MNNDESQSQAPQLKPCPFCGAPAAVYGFHITPDIYVACENTECNAAIEDCDSVDDAIAKWNRRRPEGTT